ncbi:putative GTP-binding protein 6 [Sitodiplosis mosellana]|uniref:putative GTP-binding protein 6 n=1 Tax=Sitodiplosis mosellana TaxID=263140 RepID=UPI002444DE07|nr:putative GTP-binding protein 6 [Sitodiplosis mosellana]XP_055319408.1 putative GTP-binding protein 6 [Sitodiplosis mosellana]
MLRHLSTRFLTYTYLRRAAQIELNARQFKYPLASNCGELLHIRQKYVTSGIQGRRNSKTASKKYNEEAEDEDGFDELENTEDRVALKNSEYNALLHEAFGMRKSIQCEENVFVIQPYVKWGPNKSNVSPDIKLKEAEDLIRSLDTWNITESIKVPLIGFGLRTFFGRGKMDELKKRVKMYNGDIDQKVSAVFVSVSKLDQPQKIHLEALFGVPVMDRFSIVIQILSAHATSREAKLQIALAELPYIWHHLGTEDSAVSRSKLTDSQRRMLRTRERRIKNELEHIREHRKMVRKRRLSKEYPIVAVVGYTNAGKTSLIKALTNQDKLEPKNKLFATLDVTAHAGRLPCNLQVIYIDTIGFMSDIPTELIECFITTLEDAMMADLIIHVQDVAHINVADQRQHVERTLRQLMYSSESERSQLFRNIINVGNKCDLVEDLDESKQSFEKKPDRNETSEPMHFVSCHKGSGVENLINAIEKNILKVTNRKKMIIRVPQGGEELAWLYKNTAVIQTDICDKNNEYLNVHVLLTDLNLTQFKNNFLKKVK